MKADDVYKVLRNAARGLDMKFNADGCDPAVGEVRIQLRRTNIFGVPYDQERVERIIVRAGCCFVAGKRYGQQIQKIVNVTKDGKLPLAKVVAAIKAMAERKAEDVERRKEVERKKNANKAVQEATMIYLTARTGVDFGTGPNRITRGSLPSGLQVQVLNDGRVDIGFSGLSHEAAVELVAKLER